MGISLSATGGLCGIVILANHSGWFHFHTVIGGPSVDAFDMSAHHNTSLIGLRMIEIPSLLICSVARSELPPLDEASCSSYVCISAHNMPQNGMKVAEDPRNIYETSQRRRQVAASS
jgi:hypothetical protein